MSKQKKDKQFDLENYRQEAERMKALDKATQRQIIALYRDHASKRTLPKRDREECKAKADALEKLLGLVPKR